MDVQLAEMLYRMRSTQYMLKPLQFEKISHVSSYYVQADKFIHIKDG